jgi:hypothetical protein
MGSYNSKQVSELSVNDIILCNDGYQKITHCKVGCKTTRYTTADVFSGKITTQEDENDKTYKLAKTQYKTYKVLNVIERIKFESETPTHTAQLILSGKDGTMEMEIRDTKTIKPVIKNISNKDIFVTLLWIDDTYKITEFDIHNKR